MNVNGLIFTVTESAGGAFGNLPIKEWLPAILVDIKQKLAPFGQCLEWYFELQGDEYSYEKDGEMKQRGIKGTTSLVSSSQSKMYAWYCLLSGTQPQQGDNIDLQEILGSSCRIMVGEIRQGKQEGSTGFQNVVDVSLPQVQKPVPQRVAAKPTVQTKAPVAQPKAVSPVKAVRPPQILNVPNPGNVTEPEDIDINIFETL